MGGFGDLGVVRGSRAPSFSSEFCMVFKEFSLKKRNSKINRKKQDMQLLQGGKKHHLEKAVENCTYLSAIQACQVIY